MTKNTNKKYRIKSKFRFITFMVVIIALAVGTVGYFSGYGDSVALTDPYSEVQVEVADGDTLWDIAYEYKSSDKDVREAVYEISKANDIQNGHIEAGMILTIPQTL